MKVHLMRKDPDPDPVEPMGWIACNAYQGLNTKWLHTTDTSKVTCKQCKKTFYYYLHHTKKRSFEF